MLTLTRKFPNWILLCIKPQFFIVRMQPWAVEREQKMILNSVFFVNHTCWYNERFHGTDFHLSGLSRNNCFHMFSLLRLSGRSSRYPMSSYFLSPMHISGIAALFRVPEWSRSSYALSVEGYWWSLKPYLGADSRIMPEVFMEGLF